jgi:phage N-6-adenine-methyltransferase
VKFKQKGVNEMSKGYTGSKTPLSIRDLWQTPKAFFNFYDNKFNFTTDVASSIRNRFCADHRSERFDGLLTGWGDRNWCNPPFSNATPWVKKAIEQMGKGRLTVMLLPADTSVKWFKLAFESCSECHFISGRLAFVNSATGKPVSGNNKGSVVFVFNPMSQIKSQVVLLDRDDVMGVSNG